MGKKEEFQDTGRVASVESSVPPLPEQPRRRWENPWALVGVVTGFLLFIVPGIFALRSYINWRTGQKDRPLFAWVWAWVGSVVLLLLAVLVPIGVATDKTMFKDDFSNRSGGWASGSTEQDSVGFVRSEYQILVKVPNFPTYSTVDVGRTASAVSVQVDVHPASPNTPEGAFGVACAEGSTGAKSYAFLVDPSVGGYAIVKRDGDQVIPIQNGTDSTGVVRRGGTNRIRGDCVAGATGQPTTLVLWVNGTRLLSVNVPDGFRMFGGVGLVVISRNAGGVDARFDNVHMSKL